LVKTAIRHSDTFDFKSHGSICENLMRLNIANKTYLNIVKRKIITYQDKNLMQELISPEIDEVPNALMEQHFMTQFSNSNYILPL
jgi:hypothetical protein